MEILRLKRVGELERSKNGLRRQPHAQFVELNMSEVFSHPRDPRLGDGATRFECGVVDDEVRDLWREGTLHRDFQATERVIDLDQCCEGN